MLKSITLRPKKKKALLVIFTLNMGKHMISVTLTHDLVVVARQAV